VDRRRFLRAGATSPFLLVVRSLLLASCSPDAASDNSGHAQAPPDVFPVIDYGLSFIHGKASWNKVRFEIQSRMRIFDDRAAVYEDYYRCASCKAERTFATHDLFSPDNFDFSVVFGQRNSIQFERTAGLNPGYRRVIASKKLWEGHVVKLRQPRTSHLLPTSQVIREATNEGLPLVAQTEIANPAIGLRALLEFPVRTMNVHDEKDLYQVDTGPIAYPDLSQRYPRLIDSISLAFVAFNKATAADFIIEAETPILHFGREAARVHHYSRTITMPVQNRIFAIER